MEVDLVLWPREHPRPPKRLQPPIEDEDGGALEPGAGGDGLRVPRPRLGHERAAPIALHRRSTGAVAGGRPETREEQREMAVVGEEEEDNACTRQGAQIARSRTHAQWHADVDGWTHLVQRIHTHGDQVFAARAQVARRSSNGRVEGVE